MNALAALPGLRELRSALVGGYLWIIFLWLLLDPSVNQGDLDAGPYRSAHHLGNDVGPVAVGIALTFAAYLVGTGANEVRGFISSTYLRARQTALTRPQRLTTLSVLRGRGEGMKWWAEKFKGGFKGLDSLSFPGAGQFLGAVVTSLARALRQLAIGVGTALRRTSTVIVGLPIAVIDDLASALAGAISEALDAIGSDPYSPYLSTRGVLSVERYLTKAIPTVAAVGPVPGVADVIADFEVIRNRLIASSPATVAEIDSLAGEAELRTAIVWPMVPIAMVFGVEVSAWWLAAVPVLFAFGATSRRKRHQAADLIADALVLETVAAPSVEIFLVSAQTG